MGNDEAPVSGRVDRYRHDGALSLVWRQRWVQPEVDAGEGAIAGEAADVAGVTEHADVAQGGPGKQQAAGRTGERGLVLALGLHALEVAREGDTFLLVELGTRL